MKNSFEEIYSENNEWMQSKFATYGNAKNTWTGYEKQRQILDYIFYQTFGDNDVITTVESADLTFFKVINHGVGGKFIVHTAGRQSSKDSIY